MTSLIAVVIIQVSPAMKNLYDDKGLVYLTEILLIRHDVEVNDKY